MEKTQKLEETIKQYRTFHQQVADATVLSEVDQAEKGGVAALQLMQYQVVAAGDDLYRECKRKRIQLRQEAVAATLHSTPAPEPAENLPKKEETPAPVESKDTPEVAEKKPKSRKAKK